MLIYTTATGEAYRAMAARQRDGLRAHGYTGTWRCIADAPGEFGADGLCAEAGAESDRTINRRQKTRLLELGAVAPGESIAFLEADVQVHGPVSEVLSEAETDGVVLVQRGFLRLRALLQRQRSEAAAAAAPDLAAPWCGMVAVPSCFGEAFFARWREAHGAAILGYDEVALWDTLQSFPWRFSEAVQFPPSTAPLVHYQGAFKSQISPQVAAEIATQKARLLALAMAKSRPPIGPVSAPSIPRHTLSHP